MTRTLWRTEHLDAYLANPADDGRHRVRDGETPNLISSLCEDGQHMPVIDLDIEHAYVASSTSGHGHLYIDKPMDWATYKQLLTALFKAGIIEYGFYTLSLERHASFVRVPGLKKESA